MTPKPQTHKPEALPEVYPDVEPGDHVYFRHPERGPMSAKVLATGKHGLTATCPMGDLYRVHWERVLGVKERMNRKFKLVENGAEGCILEDDQGQRRYVAHAEDEGDEDGKPLHKSQPTPAQIEAGNYKKRHVRFQGLEISIENPAGSVRKGVDRDGHEWRTQMVHAYGYIRGSKGVDKDHVDCYLGPNPDAGRAYIIHQRKAGQWDRFDEDKVMLGFDTEAQAKAAYLKHYDDPRFLGPVTAMPMDEFKTKVLATAKRPAMIKAFPDHARALFLKTFIQGYVKRDGTAVQAHTDKRHPARQAAKAIRPLGGTVIGNAIPKDIVPVTGLNLLDKTVRTNEDIARICQVYRNPLYETFRVFYVRNGLIVGQCGLSARMPGTTPIPHGYENDINRQTERLKAEQVWLVHNHPSGDPTPSDSDRSYTFKAERDIRNFAGHVIINSGKYSAYSPKTGWKTDAYLKKLSVLEDDIGGGLFTYNLENTGNFSGRNQWLMKSPEDNPKIVAEIAKRASMARGNIVLTSITRVPGRIRAIAELPANALQEPERTARRLNLLSATGDIILRQRDTVLAYLKLFAVQTGATQGMILFCPHEYRAEYEWLGEANVLLDVLSEDEDGNTRSLREDSPDLFDSRRGSWLGPESPKSELVEDFFTRMGYDAPLGKSHQDRALFLKTHVKAHTRRLPSGKVATVGAYTDRRRERDERTGDLFAAPDKAPEPAKPKMSWEMTLDEYEPTGRKDMLPHTNGDEWERAIIKRGHLSRIRFAAMQGETIPQEVWASHGMTAADIDKLLEPTSLDELPIKAVIERGRSIAEELVPGFGRDMSAHSQQADPARRRADIKRQIVDHTENLSALQKELLDPEIGDWKPEYAGDKEMYQETMNALTRRLSELYGELQRIDDGQKSVAPPAKDPDALAEKMLDAMRKRVKASMKKEGTTPEKELKQKGISIGQPKGFDKYPPETVATLDAAKKKAIADTLADFTALFGIDQCVIGSVVELKTHGRLKSEGRGFYDRRADGGALVNIGHDRPDFRTVLFHELGHSMRSHESHQACRKFVIGRRKSDVPEKLKGESYDDWEQAFTDHFIAPYVGKDWGLQGDTEVLSMGVERFANAETLARFATQDPEHFYLVLACSPRLRGFSDIRDERRGTKAELLKG